MAASLRDTADCLLQNGDRNEAFGNLEQAEGFFRRLRQVNDHLYREDLAQTLLTKATLADLVGDRTIAVAALEEGLQIFRVSGRATSVSARICILLFGLLEKTRDSRSTEIASIGVFHILFYAAAAQQTADRAELLLYTLALVSRADPTPSGPLRGPVFRLAEELGV